MLVELKEQVLLILEYSWPMIVMAVIVAITVRMGYLRKNNQKTILYKEIFNLLFILYILCLFHAVTYQDVSWASANLIPFKEILRYDFGSSLFYKNIFGNLLLFLPYGLYITHYLDLKKPLSVMSYAFIISLYAVASSIAVKFSLCKFSSKAICIICSSEKSLTIAGIVVIPASLLAFTLLSPAIMSYPFILFLLLYLNHSYLFSS